MLEKNKAKKERAGRRQTFVGVRPARFKKKTAYDRKATKAETRKRAFEDQSSSPHNSGIFYFKARSPYIGRLSCCANCLFLRYKNLCSLSFYMI